MQRKTFLRLAGAGLVPALALAPPWARAQMRQVRTVLPFSAGSGPDAVVRSVGEKLAAAGKAQLLVDNRPGANGWIAADAVKRAPADGNTLLLVDVAQMSLQQHVYKQVPFDAARDFEPAAPLYSAHFFIVVPASSPWKNVGDLLAAARREPGRVTYGTWGVGSVAHVGAAMLERATGTRMTHVPFKEIPQLYAAVATGEVGWAFGSAATVAPLHKAGKVRLLALAASRRVAGYEDVPTVAEAGGPAGFELRTWVALVAPRGTPATVIALFNEAVNQALRLPDIQARLAGFGFQPWIAPAAEIARATAEDSARFGPVVRAAKISVD